MGGLVATEAVGAAAAGFASSVVGVVPVCVALGVVPLVVAVRSLARPLTTSRMARHRRL